MADFKKYVNFIFTAENKMGGELKGVESNVNKLQDSFASSATKALALVGGVTAIGYALKKSVMEGANFQSIQNSFDQLAGNVGMNADEMIASLKRASGGTISETNLMLTANKAMTFGIGRNSQELAGMMEFARQSAKKMGLTTTQAFDNLTTGIARNSIMILDNLGITSGDMKKAQEAYAKELGKTADQLTEVESKQAMVNASIAKAREETELNGEMQLTMNERMQQAKAVYSDFTAQIGQYFLPIVGKALDAVSGSLANMLNWLRADADGFNYVGKVMQGTLKWFKMMAMAGKLLAEVISAVVVSIGIYFYDMGKTVVATFKDVIRNFKEFALSIGNGWDLIKQGKFTEAWGAVKDGAKFTFDAVARSQADTTALMQGAWQNVGTTFDSLGATVMEFNEATQTGFQLSSDKVFNMKDSLTQLGEGLGEVNAQGSKANEELQKSFDKLGESVSKTWTDLNTELGTVAERIMSLQQEMNDALVGKVKSETDLKKQYAEAYVSEEQKIADKQKEINAETDAVKRATMQADLDNQIAILDSKKTIEIAYQKEIQEARRVAGLTDFQRTLEELQQKQNSISQEFEAKKNKIESELALEYEKQKTLQDLRQQALNQIQRELGERENMTTASINREIEKWNSLAKAIQSAKAGQTSGSLSANGVTGRDSKVYNINISGNNFGGNASGQDVASALMKKLSFNQVL